MDDIEKKCEHTILVNATRERIKEGDNTGRCVTCHESVEIGPQYHQIGEYLYGKGAEGILLKVNCLE